MANSIDLIKKPTLFDKIKASLNLIIADAKRIKLDIFMIIITVLTFLSIILISGMFKLVVVIMQFASESEGIAEELKLANQMLSGMSYGITMSYSVLGFFILAAISIFSSRDFGYKTIRLKVLAGNSRTKIFFSAFIVNLLIGLVFYVGAAIVTTLLNLILFGAFFNNGTLFFNTLLGTLPYIATIAIATFITMTTRSQVMSIIINLGIAYIIPQATLVISMMFSSSEVAINIIGSIPYQTVNEIFIGDFGMSSLDSGSSTYGTTLSLSLILRATIAPTVITVAALLGGLRIFKKADLN